MRPPRYACPVKNNCESCSELCKLCNKTDDCTCVTKFRSYSEEVISESLAVILAEFNAVAAKNFELIYEIRRGHMYNSTLQDSPFLHDCMSWNAYVTKVPDVLAMSLDVAVNNALKFMYH